jgi:hypothetical protein
LKRIVLLVAALAAGVGAYLALRDPGVTRPTSVQTAQDARSAEAAAGVPEGALRAPTRGSLRSPLGVTRPISGQDAGGAAVERERPALPPQGRVYAFEDETRDAVWADEQERELTLRVRKIVGDLSKLGKKLDITGIECRRTLCRMTLLAPDAATLGTMYGALEEPSGLLGWADHLLLEAVTTEDDGRVRTGVLAVFERDPEP